MLIPPHKEWVGLYVLIFLQAYTAPHSGQA